MAIENFYTTEFTIKSLADIEDTDKEEFEAGTTKYYCHLQQMDSDFAMGFEGGVSKYYQIWCSNDVDLKQGNRIVIDSEEYEVSSVIYRVMMRNRSMSGNKHLKAIIFKTN